MTTQLVLAALGGIAAIVLLIVWLKVHPFLSLMAGAGVMAMPNGSTVRGGRKDRLASRS